MFPFSTRPRDRRNVLLARADCVIQKVRANLPPSSLWHEKRFASNQLESIAIVSAGGLYDVNTFDFSVPDSNVSREMLHLSDLGFSLCHVSGSHNPLSLVQIEQLVQDASDDFDQLIESDGVSTISMVRRVTATIGFSLPGVNADEFAHESFIEISRLLGLDLTYVPYITNECWLPDSDFYDAIFTSEDGRSAAEFVLSELQNFETIDARIKSSFAASGTLRAPGIRAKIPNRDQPYDIHFVGRAF